MTAFYYGKSSKNQQYYFRLRDNNNETILASTTGYQTEEDCLNGIEAVKKHAPDDSNYKRLNGAGNLYYFVLWAENYEPIGKSEGYTSAYNRDRSIENCKMQAPDAIMKKLETF
jgi:uncharacterized protein